MSAVGTQPGTDYDALAAAIAKALEPLVSAQNRPIQAEIVSTEVSSGHSGQLRTPIETLYTREIIVEKGKRYTRETHPLLFAVVDWMETESARREMSVRGIAAEFEKTTNQSVSKSWAAVAKNYWIANKDG